jgi:hypothetical protein
VNARTRILVALCAAALAATLLMWDSAAAGADYSDHGEPQTSLVASTHPQTYTGGGGELVRTGSPIGWLALAGVAVLICGGVVSLASTKRRPS